jgi:hypothetical protein
MTTEELREEARRCAEAAGIYFEGIGKHAEGVVVFLAGQPRGGPPRPGDAAHEWGLSVDELRALVPAGVCRYVESVARMMRDLRRRPTI